METRTLGRTGLRVSVLGFGCGAVGGLMVRGEPADQERAVALAVERGVTYFDTAPSYGEGRSEQNLGRVLAKLKPDVRVGTKVRLSEQASRDIGQAIPASLEASLRRLQRDSVDLFQLHDPIVVQDEADSVRAAAVLEQVVPAFERLREQGKTRCFGITAIGDADALLRVIDARAIDTAQVSYNLLNPSAGAAVAADYPAQDFRRLLDRARAAGVGVIGIRVLAGGALSGSAERHPIATPTVEPIGSAWSYEADVARARRLQPLVDEGFAGSLPEAAIRFAISNPAVSTILVGIATVAQFEGALAAAEKGVLPPAALARAAALQAGFAGEPR